MQNKECCKRPSNLDLAAVGGDHIYIHICIYVYVYVYFCFYICMSRHIC